MKTPKELFFEELPEVPDELILELLDALVEEMNRRHPRRRGKMTLAWEGFRHKPGDYIPVKTSLPKRSQ